MHERRPKGEGTLWRRGKRGLITIQFTHNGQLHRERTGTADESKANKLLKQRWAEAQTGTLTPSHTKRIRITELAEDLFQEYRANARKSIDDAVSRWKLHLQPFFGHLRVADLTSDHINRYILQRHQQGAKNATIN